MKKWEDHSLDEEFPVYLDALSSIIEVESIEKLGKTESPFGEGPKEALNRALAVAEDWGFKTTNIDDAIGYAEWINDSETDDYVGVLGHLDVVPAGTGWSSPPFQLTIEDNKAFGRGVLDNKGPTMAALFAAKRLKDSKQAFNKNLRIIFGTNEETGSKDLAYYLNREKPPIYGFTPDSQFPAVYGEKGVVSLRYTTPFSLDDLMNLKEIKGEFISSSVPDAVTVLFEDESEQTFNGERAPSNEPQLGINALTQAVVSLQHTEKLSKRLQRYFQWIASTFHQKHFGEGLRSSGNRSIPDMDIQITPFSLKKEGNSMVFEVSFRYSIDYKEAQLLSLLEKNTFEDTQMTITRSMPPKTFDQNHPMLTVMKEAYEEVTGLDGTPIVTTGATYARFMPNIIAFGPSFPGQIGIAHNRDEYMYIDDLKRNIKIYEWTLKELLH